MSGVLSDIRVLDFGRYVAGPYCATLLGYLGADVIRVERPGGGEDRKIAPVTENREDGAVFLQTGCNKRSLCMHLGHSNRDQVLGPLIRSADVVVCNFPGPTLKKLGLDLESLQSHREDIILANVTAFGEGGPLSKRGGFDGVGQAMSGSMYITGTPGEPVKAATPFVDYTSATLCAFGVLAALRHRDQTGRGQQVSGTLLGTAMAMFNSHLIEQGVLGLNRVGTGNRVQTSAPSDVFATKDGHVLIHSPGDRIFERCARLIGKSEWLSDTRFSDDQARGDHRDEICQAVAQWCKDKSVEEVLEILAKEGIPAGPVLTPQQAIDHPQTEFLEILNQQDYPGIPKPAPVADLPITLSESPSGIRQSPATAGAHTDEILGELGFSDSQISSMRGQGVVA